MDPSGALLSFIHKNAAMGVGAIPQAMSLPQSRAMVPALNRQLREYRAIAAQSQAYARAHGRRELRGPGTAALAMSAAMLRAQSMLDPSPNAIKPWQPFSRYSRRACSTLATVGLATVRS